MKKYMVIVSFMMLTTIAALGQDVTPRADARQGAQRARIHQGRRSGEVTNGEAAALNSEQRHIRRSERRAKADGEVTAKEKIKLERKQDRASRHIRRAKRNPIDNN